MDELNLNGTIYSYANIIELISVKNEHKVPKTKAEQNINIEKYNSRRNKIKAKFIAFTFDSRSIHNITFLN